MKTGRWLKVECSPSDTPPILLPRHLPPSLSFAANSLRSHMPLCDSMAGTGLPADVRRCSEWICFPPPASCFSQTQKNLPSPSFEGRDRVWRSAGDDVPWGAGCSSQECSAFAEDPLLGRCRKSCAGTASCPFNQNPPSETPSRPSPRIPHPKPPHTTQPRISNLPSKSSLFY